MSGIESIVVATTALPAWKIAGRYRLRGGVGVVRAIARSVPIGRSLAAAALAILIGTTTLSALAGADEISAGASFLEALSIAPPTLPVLIVCHGFGCAYRDTLYLTPAQLNDLRRLLRPARNAADERKALFKSVAWLDRQMGAVAGTLKRTPYAALLNTGGGPSQMDCIDLTADITGFLMILRRLDLLRYHRVGEPVSRGFLNGGGPHTAPVVVEISSGSQWVIDSWTRANGELPETMLASEWKKRK